MVANSKFYSADRAIQLVSRMYREGKLWLIEIEVPDWILEDLRGELKSTDGVEIQETNLKGVIRISQKLPLF